MSNQKKWHKVNSREEIRKPMLFPFHKNYECVGFGYFYNKTKNTGYMGTTSHLWDAYSKLRNCVLSYFGYMLVYNCDGHGSHLERSKGE